MSLIGLTQKKMKRTRERQRQRCDIMNAQPFHSSNHQRVFLLSNHSFCFLFAHTSSATPSHSRRSLPRTMAQAARLMRFERSTMQHRTTRPSRTCLCSSGMCVYACMHVKPHGALRLIPLLHHHISIHHPRRRLLQQTAERLGIRKVLVGDCATQLAARVIALTSLGRGMQIVSDTVSQS